MFPQGDGHHSNPAVKHLLQKQVGVVHGELGRRPVIVQSLLERQREPDAFPAVASLTEQVLGAISRLANQVPERRSRFTLRPFKKGGGFAASARKGYNLKCRHAQTIPHGQDARLRIRQEPYGQSRKLQDR